MGSPFANTDEPIERYNKALDASKSLEALKATLETWRYVASDAADLVAAMTPEDFTEFRRGLLGERRGKFAGEAWAEKWAAVLMPRVLFEAGLVATEFQVPWGLAFNRMVEAGQIAHDGSCWHVIPRESPNP